MQYSLLYNLNQIIILQGASGGQPKSILKRTNSQTLRQTGPMATPSLTPYSTVTGAEGRYVKSYHVTT